MQDVPAKPREGERAAVSMVARYRSPTTFEYVEEACLDVSVGGMFIRSSSPAAAGTLLKLECASRDGGAKIHGVARVVWLRTRDGIDGPPGMGVKFVKLEGPSRAAIEGIVRRSSETSEPPPHQGEVITTSLVPKTMTLADAAASAEPLPVARESARDVRMVLTWTAAGMVAFAVLLSTERFHGGGAARGTLIVISEDAARHAAEVHAASNRPRMAAAEAPRTVAPVVAAPILDPAVEQDEPEEVSVASPEAAPSPVPPPQPAQPLQSAKRRPPRAPSAKASPPARPVAPAVEPAAPKAAAVPAMVAATACLARGDNACVVAVLQGRAKTAHEHELLIETLRAMGRSGEARKHMSSYIARFPDERRATTYQRMLAAQAADAQTSAPAPGPARAAPGPEPEPEPEPSTLAPKPTPAPAPTTPLEPEAAP